MRIDFLGLQAFVGVAEHGSFQRAAAHLNLSQTALSHRMRKFEEYIGVKLLTRTTRQVTLTAAGVALLPKALQIINDAQNSLGEMRDYGGIKQERLAIGCIPTLAGDWLPTLLRDFIVDQPGLAIKIYDNSAAEIAAYVESGLAEFAVTILSINRPHMEVRPLLDEPLVLVAPADHPLASRPSVEWADLRGVPLVRIAAEGGNRILVDDALRQRSEQLLWRFEAQRASTAIALVSTGACLAVVPAFTVARTRTPPLAIVPLRNPRIHRKIGIIFKQNGELSAAASALIKHLQKGARRMRLPA